MSEILAQGDADMQIKYDPLSDKYVARISGREREFDTVEQAVVWCCEVRDHGGRP